MAMNHEGDLDKNEAATPYKLLEARKRGQVARSTDLVSALVIAGAAVLFYAKGWTYVLELFRLDRRLAVSVATGVGVSDTGAWSLVQLFVDALDAAMALILPPVAVLMAVAIVSSVWQTGPVFSFHPVKPDWQRLNPATGFKRVFSMRTLFDTGRALVKISVLTVVIAAALTDLTPHLWRLSDITTFGHAGYLVRDIGVLAIKVALALVVIALIDIGYTRREFAKNMRMSRREVRDESKNREGDPRIRGRLRQLRQELLKRSQSLRKTATADLIITNPTHVAVALRYRHGEMAAPVVVSKGTGAMAAAIRKIAARHRIPVLRSPALARALNRQAGIDAFIPAELYPGVARLFVWVLGTQAPSARSRGRAA
jgi:flagellar biosynthesis protein FlhB